MKEVLQAVSRSLHVRRNVEFIFSGIGSLSIRDARVKMKFSKEFVKSMDNTGELVNALRNVCLFSDIKLSRCQNGFRTSSGKAHVTYYRGCRRS